MSYDLKIGIDLGGFRILDDSLFSRVAWQRIST